MNKCVLMLAVALGGGALTAAALPPRAPAASVSRRFVATFADRVAAANAPWIVTDRVTARTETSLTIGEQRIEIGSNTTVVSGGVGYRTDDIRVGDRVRAKIQKGPAETLHAMSVELLLD